MLLFLAFYLDKYPNKKVDEIYEVYLENCISELSDGLNNYTYSNGLAGVLYVLKAMNDNNLINLDFSDIENNYKDALTEFAYSNIVNRNYDFMHGGLGIPLYFIDDKPINELVVKALSQTAIQDGDKMKWLSSLGPGKGNGFNIALSHGMSSIAIYLSRVFKIFTKNYLVSKMLVSTINYILSQAIDREKYSTCFATQSLENGELPHKGRLAWCYGDLGVGAALWQAGKAANNREWKDIALDIYMFSAQKRDLTDAMVKDAGICHGSAGIAMMFGYMYKETNKQMFLDARNYWIDITLRFAFHKDGLAGYKAFRLKDDLKTPTSITSYVLLEGVAGIGLMLMSMLHKDVEKTLHETMLLY